MTTGNLVAAGSTGRGSTRDVFATFGGSRDVASMPAPATEAAVPVVYVWQSLSQMFSILHISDLHRSPHDPISNDELISALVADRERYTREEPNVSPPKAIVVSGDIILGVKLGEEDFSNAIKEQYAVADRFLGELVDRFLAGDRSRLIMVPGNHDVDWNTAFAAMTEVHPVPENVLDRLHEDRSPFRWDWKKQRLFRISDQTLYGKRLDAFWNFHSRFYAGVGNLLRVKSGADSNLFSLHNGRIGLAAFNSCDGNDCFAFHGRIRPEVVSRSHLDLTAEGLEFGLRICVWHHSIEGPPYRTDYMDIETVRAMIGRGFRLGLYGHQHKAQAFPHSVLLPDRETMAVISAGSLCAGARELPVGTPRQYNVVEVSDDLRSVRVHVRQMGAGTMFGRAFLQSLGGTSHVDLAWEPAKDIGGRAIDAKRHRHRALILEGEQALKAGDFETCKNLLLPLAHELDGHGRRLLLDATQRLENWGTLRDLLATPETIDELTMRIAADLRQRQFVAARSVLNEYGPKLELDKGTHEALRDRIALEENLHQ